MKFFLWGILIFLSMLMVEDVSAEKGPEVREFSVGLEQYKAGDFQKAIESFQAAAAKDPGNAEIHYYLGLAHLRLKQSEQSVSFFQKALELNPNLAKVYFDLGVAYYELGKMREALEEFKKAQKVLPETALVYYYQGLIYHKLEQFRRTPPFWRKAMELDAKLTLEAHYYNGIGYHRRELFDEAESEFQEAIKVNPEAEMAQSAKRFLETIEKERVEKAKREEELKKVEKPEEEEAPVKRYEFVLGLGYFYDDNVILNPRDSDILGVAPTNEIDLSPTFLFSATYNALRTDRWELSGTYRFDQVLYQQLKDFDSQTHTVTLDAIYKISDTKQLLLDYYYTYYGVNNQKTLVQNTISSGFRWAETANLVTEFRYDLSKKDFFIPLPVPEENLNATGQTFSLAQFLFFANNTRYFRFSYSFADEEAKGENRDYKANVFATSFSTPLFFISELSFGISYEDRDYFHLDTLKGAKRADITRIFSISAKRYFRKNFQAILSYAHTRNGSTIAEFDYERDLVGLEMQYTF